MSRAKAKPVILVTQGDPLGIGPEIIVKALQDKNLRAAARWVVIASGRVMRREPGYFPLEKSKSIIFCDVDSLLPEVAKMDSRRGASRGAPTSKRRQLITSQEARNAGLQSLRCLEIAVRLLRDGSADALVTAPISKAHVRLVGFRFPGHTEYLAHTLCARETAMLLFSGSLRVVPVTIHVPLKAVAKLLSPPDIKRCILLAVQSLQNDFGIHRPRIAVCALNPHGGEAGLIGNEEIKIIAPAVRAAARGIARGVQLTGPFPADTLFYKAMRGDYDAVVCMYHDQALIPLKMTGFERGVNMTLGLPCVRTSPDHGTAFDIAGRGIADPLSMTTALQTAVTIAARRML